MKEIYKLTKFKQQLVKLEQKQEPFIGINNELMFDNMEMFDSFVLLVQQQYKISTDNFIQGIKNSLNINIGGLGVIKIGKMLGFGNSVED